MEDKIKARYRNKVGKIIIEVWNGDKWLYVKTLSNPLKEFEQECLRKVSLNGPIKQQNQPEKFVQDLLSEVSDKDTVNKKTLLEAAKEAQNKLMNEILNK